MCPECGMTGAELAIVALVYLIPLCVVLGIGALVCDWLAKRETKKHFWEVK